MAICYLKNDKILSNTGPKNPKDLGFERSAISYKKPWISCATVPKPLALLEVLAILSDTTARTSGVNWEKLKPY